MGCWDLSVGAAVAGSVDAGKSTLVAVLTHGSDGQPLLDNSAGSARMSVFRHKHEIESGRTSSISQQMLGYDREGAHIHLAYMTTTRIVANALVDSFDPYVEPDNLVRNNVALLTCCCASLCVSAGLGYGGVYILQVAYKLMCDTLLCTYPVGMLVMLRRCMILQ